MIALLVTLAVGCSTPAVSPTSTPAAVATATTAPSASAALTIPSASASPAVVTAATPNYVNNSHKFSLVLPAPYRRSERLSMESTGRLALQDAFTPRTVSDEAAIDGSSETASPRWNYTAVVQIYTNVSDTARGFYTSFGGAVGESIVDVTVDGRPAVRVTAGAPYPFQYVIKDGSRIVRVAYQSYPDMAVPAGATKDKLVAILESFRFMP